MKNKQQKFLDLFDPVKNNLWRYCLSVSLSGDDARDLLQDTIETAYVQFDKLKHKIAFLSYLFSIASRLNGRRRRESARKVKPDEEFFAGLIAENSHADTLHDIKVLYSAFAELPPEQHEAIVLFDIMGFSQKEICEIQEVSLDTLKQRLYRGRKKLSELINDDGHNNNQKKILHERRIK